MSSGSHSVPALFYLFAFCAIILLGYNLRRFFCIRIGKEETDRPVNFFSAVWNGLIFGVGQRRVMRKRFSYATIMHFLLGWGFIELVFATTVDFFMARGWFTSYLPELDTPWFAFVNDLGGIMLLTGLLLALFRRHINKPEPLPHSTFKGRGNLFGDTGILLFLLILGIGGFLTEASRLAVDQPLTANFSWVGLPISKFATVETWLLLQPVLWWSHALASLLFIAILPVTKVFHALAVIVNVALTNRKKQGHLRPMHLSELMEDPDIDVDNLALGVNEIKNFTWKQLLDSIACTECSRCTSVCPAYNTDKPLSPMKIITDIRQTLYDQTLKKTETTALINNDLISETALWSCTTCGACMEECPVLIDHVPTFTDLRRFLILSEGKPPGRAGESLEKTLSTGNPWGFSQQDRIKWAKDTGIELPVMMEKKVADVLYWIGCAGAYDPRNQMITRSMVKIFESAGIDYGVLGIEEKCTGDSARRMGEEYLFETMALQNIETLNKYKFKTIVTACPHCFHTLINEYPDFGGNYSVMHHSQYIEELINTGKLVPENHINHNITFHDPCYLGRHNGVYESPRKIIKKVLDGKGLLIEMESNRNESFCCGAGGGNMWYEIDEGERINLKRFEQAMSTGAETIATACSFCTIMMDDAMKVKGKENSVRILDIAEIVAKGL